MKDPDGPMSADDAATIPDTDEITIWSLTPLGVLQHCLGDEDGRRAFDALELYALRSARGAGDAGIPAVVFHEPGARFIVVSRAAPGGSND